MDTNTEQSDSKPEGKNEGKSLLEEIWEQKHPDQVKKQKEDEEQKRLAKQAKELEDQAYLLSQKSKAIKAL